MFVLGLVCSVEICQSMKGLVRARLRWSGQCAPRIAYKDASGLALLPSRGRHPGCWISPPTQIRQCAAARARVQLTQLGTGELWVIWSARLRALRWCAARAAGRAVWRALERDAREPRRKGGHTIFLPNLGFE